MGKRWELLKEKIHIGTLPGGDGHAEICATEIRESFHVNRIINCCGHYRYFGRDCRAQFLECPNAGPTIPRAGGYEKYRDRHPHV